MILINVRFRVLPEYAETWLDRVRDFTDATRAEPGNLWYDWYRSVDDPTVFFLSEAFREGDAPAEHVNSAHFATAMAQIPQWLAQTPDIINTAVPGLGWSQMAELIVEPQ